MSVLARLLPTLLLAAAFLTLAALIVAVLRLMDRRDAARTAERRARPHSTHIGTAAQDAAAVMHAAASECPGCAAEERTRGVIQLSALELYPPDHTCPPSA